MLESNIEKSFFCLGKSQANCFGCSYCRAIDSCNKHVEFNVLPTEISKSFLNVPIAINLFYGDPLLQIDNTIDYLRRLEKVNHKGIVTIITKGDFCRFPDVPFNLDLHIAFSTFGLNSKYDGGSWDRFVSNLNTIKSRKHNYTYSIEFRPICYGINDSYEILERVIKTAQIYRLPISYSGLQGKPDIVQYWKENNIGFKPYPGFSFGHVKSISSEVENTIRNLAENYKVDIFHKTSCMLSYTHGLDRDYNCHYYRPDEVNCSSCPMNDKCAKSKEELRKTSLPYSFNLEYKKKHECVLYRTGKCNYPTQGCKNISGYVISSKEQMTIADYRMTKWLTGYTVDNDFTYDERLSDFWHLT